MSAPRETFGVAADRLALRVLGALRGPGDAVFVAEYVADTPDPLSCLAALRIVGSDSFAPHLLAGAPLRPQDTAAVSQALTAFRAGDGAPSDPYVAWRDWATARLLSLHNPRHPALPPPAQRPGSGEDWRGLSDALARLAPLALPVLDSPVHELARRSGRALARGLTRAMLRRDHPTAARLVRWLCLLPGPLPLDPLAALDHLDLHGVAGPRTALDLAIARLLREPVR
ncbi:hypothetical protein [Streptomyces aidingensis]|uniref:hypothetical protein n=1 Tax=Streptomyces aidingensis TaxID=910347 RepID=UPI001FEB0F14|nr:hypothetical protein [Streptomyces aidingensis]